MGAMPDVSVHYLIRVIVRAAMGFLLNHIIELICVSHDITTTPYIVGCDAFTFFYTRRYIHILNITATTHSINESMIFSVICLLL